MNHVRWLAVVNLTSEQAAEKIEKIVADETEHGMEIASAIALPTGAIALLFRRVRLGLTTGQIESAVRTGTEQLRR